MSTALLTIVTTTFNCAPVLEAYLRSVRALDACRVDWVVIDAGSNDGTAQRLSDCSELFTHYASVPDAGIYYGLNRAVAAVKTPYYMVFGADDRPSPSLLEDLLPMLSDAPALVLGAVRLMPGGEVKRPGNRRWHPVVWGRAISHHSVGTVIRTNVHQKFGLYDVDYRVVADGMLLKKILQSEERIAISSAIFGDYGLGGISDRLRVRSIVETFLLQISVGSNLALQLMLLTARLTKLSWTSRRR